MPARIRLARGGRTHKAHYRVVVADREKPRDGRYIEVLGTYDPHKEGNEGFNAKHERIEYWIKNGAVPTRTVAQLIKRSQASA